MALRIPHNVEAFRAYRNLELAQEQVSQLAERTTAAPRESAAVTDSVRLQAQVSGLAQAQRNSQEALSLIQTGQQSLQAVSGLLDEVKGLASQKAQGADLTSLQSQLSDLHAQVQRISTNARANGIPLFAGDGVAHFQIGASAGQVVEVPTHKLLGGADADIAETIFDAESTSSQAVETAQDNLSQRTAALGETLGRLQNLMSSLDVYQENLIASLSQVGDLNVAQDTVNQIRGLLTEAPEPALAHSGLTADQVVRLLS